MWLAAAARGDVAFDRGAGQYHAGAAHLSPFMNRPARAYGAARRGGSHVAVGFADLGDIAETVAAWGDLGEARGKVKPLRWLGVDASAYTCACAAVVHAMLRSDCPIDDVVQVRADCSSGGDLPYRRSIAKHWPDLAKQNIGQNRLMRCTDAHTL